MLEVKNISLSYDNSSVIDNISFNVKKGEVVCILGESGCGKTSIINTLNCNFNLETDKDHTPLDDGKVFKDYVNNSPINPNFNSDASTLLFLSITNCKLFAIALK